MKSNMKQLKIGECWNAIITLERVSWTKGNSKRRCHYWISLINCSVLSLELGKRTLKSLRILAGTADITVNVY